MSHKKDTFRGVLDQSGILGYRSNFLGYWDIASRKLGYWDIHEEIGILVLRNLGYWECEKIMAEIWDIGPPKLGYLGYQDPL